jgi:predicted ribosomally synthesized peptide with SipW-like signal peptide
MKKKSIGKMLLASCLAASLVIGCMVGMSAYFTDGDTTTNTFTVGKVSIDLTETEWVGDNTGDALNITPLQEIAKNPVISNDGDNDAYVFMTVTIPLMAVDNSADDGTVTAATSTSGKIRYYTQLFNLGYEGNIGVRSDWTLVSMGGVNVNGSSLSIKSIIMSLAAQHITILNWDKYMDFGAIEYDDTGNMASLTYVFAYTGESSGSLEALSPGDSTSALFDYVKFANVTEDQGLELTTQDVVVNAYAIQTDNVKETTTYAGNNSDGAFSPAAVWGVVYRANPTTDVTDAEDATTDAKTTATTETTAPETTDPDISDGGYEDDDGTGYGAGIGGGGNTIPDPNFESNDDISAGYAED